MYITSVPIALARLCQLAPIRCKGAGREIELTRVPGKEGQNRF